MIHYHGTPITPRSELHKLGGRNFCVSFSDPRDINVCLKIGQSVMLDNGAFSAYTQGFSLDIDKFYSWIENVLVFPHWAVIPDVIDGSIEQQRMMVKTWPFRKSLGFPVWHLGLSINYLLELCDQFEHICLGSSGEYWKVGSDSWNNRMDEVFNKLVVTYGSQLPWIHGLRMLGQSGNLWPLTSADSANVARNHKDNKLYCADCIAKRIDSTNPVSHFKQRPLQGLLC